MKKAHKPTVGGAPHIYDTSSTVNIMWAVSFWLIPAAGWGVYIFGFRAFLVVATALGTSLLAEALLALLYRRFTLWDGSAFLTGLLVGMTLPPGVPLYIPAAASLFAIAVVKWTFGGLGHNWMNPALAGRVFVYFSFPGPMSSWTFPTTLQGADRVSAATPLGFLKAGIFEQSGIFKSPMEFLNANGYPRSLTDGTVTDWLNGKILEPLGASLPAGYVDIFLGHTPGCIGEVSALILLTGTVYLLARRIISWEIPFSYLGTFGLLVMVFGGLPFSGSFFSGDVLFHLFSGGLILGVFYMATDMVTSPLTRRGMLLYGAGAALLTFLIRLYGSFPEGVSFAIIFMNMFVPFINRCTGPRRFGRGEGKLG